MPHIIDIGGLAEQLSFECETACEDWRKSPPQAPNCGDAGQSQTCTCTPSLELISSPNVDREQTVISRDMRGECSSERRKIVALYPHRTTACSSG